MSPGSGLRPCLAARAARPMGWNKARLPPARVTRASSARPSFGSARWGSKPEPSTESTEQSGKGSRRTSPMTSAPDARRPSLSASLSISGVKSSPITRPDSPTAWARKGSARPVPHPHPARFPLSAAAAPAPRRRTPVRRPGTAPPIPPPVRRRTGGSQPADRDGGGR